MIKALILYLQKQFLPGIKFACKAVMLIAIPIWEGRVSPVFDVARHIALSTIDAGKIVSTSEMIIPDQDVPVRVKLLVEKKVDVLLWGAISGYILILLEQCGMRVIPHVCGSREQVLTAFLANRLVQDGLIMPGCGCRLHRVYGGGHHRGRWDAFGNQRKNRRSR